MNAAQQICLKSIANQTTLNKGALLSRLPFNRASAFCVFGSHFFDHGKVTFVLLE